MTYNTDPDVKVTSSSSSSGSSGNVAIIALIVILILAIGAYLLFFNRPTVSTTIRQAPAAIVTTVPGNSAPATNAPVINPPAGAATSAPSISVENNNTVQQVQPAQPTVAEATQSP